MAVLKKGLSNLNSTQLLIKATFIVNRLTDNPAFPEPTPALSVVSDAISALQASYVEALEGGVTALATRRAHETELRLLLNQLAGYVSSIAQGSEVGILSSGFDVVRPGSPAPEPSAPVDVRVAMSEHAGRADIRWEPVGVAVSYHIQCTSDPTNESLWKLVAVSTKATTKVTGLPSGQMSYFRIAGIGTAGMGPWSQVVSTLIK
jgi:hypothetical protein